MHPTSQPEETFRLIVEGAPNAIVVIDESGHVVIVNSQTEKLFGYSRGATSSRFPGTGSKAIVSNPKTPGSIIT
jgi:PAS domain-containing protein